jgi:hypothetical protein
MGSIVRVDQKPSLRALRGGECALVLTPVDSPLVHRILPAAARKLNSQRQAGTASPFKFNEIGLYSTANPWRWYRRAGSKYVRWRTPRGLPSRRLYLLLSEPYHKLAHRDCRP